MFSNKVSGFVAIFTGVTLVLQLMILFRTTCNVDLGRQKRLQQIAAADVTTLNRTDLYPKHMPHFTASSADFPGLQTDRKRRLTVGIPTVKRRDGSYFLIMLDTMLNKTSPEYLNEIVFVIFLAENNNITWKQEMEVYLKRKYQKYVEIGSLVVIQAPSSFYKSMPDISGNNYINWRTKQNFDYAYIMKYSRHLSEFYMQMEDDVTTVDNYYSAILEFTEANKNGSWVCLEFSELGFIGKLYHSRDLVRLADMLLMFNASAPVDYTFLYFNYLSGQVTRLLRKPTLFQHLGVQSSLADKVQPLRDKFFDFPEKELNGDNPPANLFTSLKVNRDFPPELAYRKVPGHFWSESGAQINDHFTIVFDTPQALAGVVIVTGGKDHPDDIFHNAVVEASPILTGKTECSDYVTIGEFQNGVANITEAAITAKMLSFKTICLKMRVTSPQNQWVIVKEIAVFVK